jgi:hypothetical protein
MACQLTLPPANAATDLQLWEDLPVPLKDPASHEPPRVNAMRTQCGRRPGTQRHQQSSGHARVETMEPHQHIKRAMQNRSATNKQRAAWRQWSRIKRAARNHDQAPRVRGCPPRCTPA